MVQFIIGLFIGAIITVFAIAVTTAYRDEEEEREDDHK